VRRRAEESWPLPARLHALADACGWSRYVESRAPLGATFVRPVGAHESRRELSVPRAPGDREAIERAAPAAAALVADAEERWAAGEEADAAAILARATARRERAARIRAALDALNAAPTTETDR
jgi:hypothetical protein